MITLTTIQSGIAQGLLWAILTLGVMLTFRVLDIADLTVEGSFPLGAAVCVMLLNAEVNPFVAVPAACLAGAVAGAVTGLLITGFRIPPILAGILTQIALYSVNIRIMGDKATVAIAKSSIKKILQSLLPSLKSNMLSIISGALVCAMVIFILYRYFGTEIGCAIRATGSNPHMARALGIDTDKTTVLCLMISNALVALSGSLIAQFDYGSALVNMGQGTIVIGLASIIIGEVLFVRKEMNFALKMSAIVGGAIIYRTVIACALTLPWMKATDLKLITAAIVAIALAVPVLKDRAAFMRKSAAAAKRNFSAAEATGRSAANAGAIAAGTMACGTEVILPPKKERGEKPNA